MERSWWVLLWVTSLWQGEVLITHARACVHTNTHIQTSTPTHTQEEYMCGMKVAFKFM